MQGVATKSVRVSLQAGLSWRWWGLLGVAVLRQVARAILRGPGYDLVEHALEPSATCLPVDGFTPSLVFHLRVGGFRKKGMCLWRAG